MGLAADAFDDFIGVPFGQSDGMKLIKERYPIQLLPRKDRSDGFTPFHFGAGRQITLLHVVVDDASFDLQYIGCLKRAEHFLAGQQSIVKCFLYRHASYTVVIKPL